MDETVTFSFPLCPRMEAFLCLRDGLKMMAANQEPYAWLLAAADVRASIIGDQGRKPALPELIGLMQAICEHLEKLAERHARFRSALIKNVQLTQARITALAKDEEELVAFLREDVALRAFANALKKQDWLAHRLALPQCLDSLWQGGEIAKNTNNRLKSLMQLTRELDGMLHEFVPWQPRTARKGSDQIIPPRNEECGLLIIGLDKALVCRGITPHISGNRFAVRIRFLQWETKAIETVAGMDIPYGMMLVPLA